MVAAGHKNHHYVPRFLLEQWQTAPDNKLTQFQWLRGNLKSERYTAKAVGKEEHLYSRMRQTAEPDVTVERDFLGPDVDEPASKVHKRLITSGVRSLTDAERHVWTRFIVSLLLRTPAMMQHMRARGRAVLAAEVDKDPDDFMELRGSEPEPTLREWLEINMPWELDDLAVRTLPDLVCSDKLNAGIWEGIWATRTLKPETRDLLIGDRPLIYVGTMESGHLIAVPISPRRLFFKAPDKTTVENVFRESEKHFTKKLNTQTTFQAERYVYSTGSQHEPLIRKHLRRAKELQ
jgi:hypothetical protein